MVIIKRISKLLTFSKMKCHFNIMHEFFLRFDSKDLDMTVIIPEEI